MDSSLLEVSLVIDLPVMRLLSFDVAGLLTRAYDDRDLDEPPGCPVGFYTPPSSISRSSDTGGIVAVTPDVDEEFFNIYAIRRPDIEGQAEAQGLDGLECATPTAER